MIDLVGAKENVVLTQNESIEVTLSWSELRTIAMKARRLLCNNCGTEYKCDYCVGGEFFTEEHLNENI